MGATYLLLLGSIGLVITAQAQDCTRPEAGPNMGLTNDYILLQTFPYQSKAVFVCNVGYQSAGGSSSVTCNAGTWTPTRLTCQKKTCGSLGEVQNGQVDYPDGNEFGNEAVITCNNGFILVGKSRISCGDKGWLDRLPVCEVLNCKPPPSVVGGSFTPDKENYEYRDVVLYSCLNGLTLNGSKSVSCSENGTFVPRPPTCVRVNCREPEIPDAVWAGGSRPPHGHMATVTYRCKSGFTMIGRSSLTCGIDNQWLPGLPKCQPPCPKPVAGPNMSLKESSETYKEGAKATFTCNIGFKPVEGSGVVTCSGGTWSPVELKCENVECRTADVENADRKGPPPPFKYKDTVMYQCKEGYRAIGSSEQTCDPNGQWSPGLPKCEHVECRPEDVANADRNGSSPPYYYKDTVKYQCKDKYKMTGTPEQTCGSDGQWSPGLPKCEQEDNDGKKNDATSLPVLLGVIFGVISVVAAGCGCFYFGVYKKKRGSSRGYRDNEPTKEGEEVALS